MTSPVRPTARCLIACERVEQDAANPRRVNLLRLITTGRPQAGRRYPVVQGEFRVFAMLTECRGVARLRVEVRDTDSGEPVFRTRAWEVRFPNEPLTVHGFRAQLVGCTFPAPGLYWVQLWCDDAVLAETPITLRP